MKRFLTLLGVVFFIEIASAQDVLITKEGDAMKVWGIEVSNSAIFYRESEAQDAAIKRFDKKDVLMIKYQDGRKVIIGEESEQPVLAAEPASNTSAPAGNVADPEANRELINSIKSNKVEFASKPSNSEAGMLFCQYMPKSNAVMADKNVSFTVTTESVITHSKGSLRSVNDMKVCVAVKNSSSKTIYIDLGNTFLTRGGQSLAYYVPTVTSHTDGTSSGVGVNMGAVAGALGIGGPVGTLARGVGISSGSSATTTTTTVAQRVVAVPPMSKKRLDAPTTLFPLKDNSWSDENIKYAGGYRDLSLFLDKSEMLKIGECRELDENFEVGAFSVVVTYADNEAMNQSQMLNADFTIQRIIGTKTGHSLDFKLFDVDDISDNYINTAYFFARQRKK